MKGIATLRSARAMTPQEIQNVRALYEQGLTAEEIARHTGRWVGTVRKHLRGRVSTPAAVPSVYQRPTLKLNTPPPARVGALDFLNIKSKGV